MGYDKFAAYEAMHTHRITLLVAPLMIAEAVLTTSACIQPARSFWHLQTGDQNIYANGALFRMLLLLVIWVRCNALMKPALLLPTLS